MKKSIAKTTILLFVLGVILGGIFNFILQQENFSIELSIMQGIFVGILFSGNYFLFFWFWAFGLYYLNEWNKVTKHFMSALEFLGVILIFYGVISFTIPNGIMPYWWMLIVILLLSILIIVKAHHDGKKYSNNHSK